MSRHPFSLSAVRVEGATEYVNDYVDHPDFRLVAAFFLGWVFFSGLRHVWFSAFLQELMWTCKAIYDDRLQDIKFTGSLHDKPARIHRSGYRRKQRGVPILLLCMAFMLASLSSFLSLLTFYPKAGQVACTFVVAATTVSSQLARMFSLLILGLDLSHHVGRLWEWHVFWLLLGTGTVLSGATAVIGSGQLLTPLAAPTVALCIRKRFLPTSLVSSILNFVLELYIILRSLSLMQPPRLKLTIVQHARIVQAGSLLLFDLLVVIPNATYTNLLTEFVPFSVGALCVLAAFNGSFGHNDFVEFAPTSLDVHISRSHHPCSTASTVRALEHTTRRGDVSGRVTRIDDPISIVARPSLDIEAYASRLQATRRYSTIPLDGHHDETFPIPPSSQPYGVSIQTTMDIVPPEAQPEPGNRLRGKKILSHSNPIWATFGSPDDSSSSASTHSETSVDVVNSLNSNDHHSYERSTKFLSTASTILGSDIIRRATSKKGRDRMRIRYSRPDVPLSTTPAVGSSRRAIHHSWLSRVPAYPTSSENASQEGSALSKERTQSSHSTSFLSSKSKQGSKSNRSSKSRKSLNSTRSAKTTGFKMAEGSPSMPVWIESSTLARPPVSLPRDRVSFVRGPRPLPSPLRLRPSSAYVTVAE